MFDRMKVRYGTSWANQERIGVVKVVSREPLQINKKKLNNDPGTQVHMLLIINNPNVLRICLGSRRNIQDD